jgi:hypothetical protein
MEQHLLHIVIAIRLLEPHPVVANLHPDSIRGEAGQHPVQRGTGWQLKHPFQVTAPKRGRALAL